MGFVRKRGSKWHAGIWSRSTRKHCEVPLPVSVTTKRDAQSAMIDLQDRADREAIGLRKRSGGFGPSWLEVAEDVLRDVSSQAGERWYGVCEKFVERFAEYAGDVPAISISSQHCRDYVRDRIADRANDSTLRKEVTFLSRVFRRAVENDLIARNPWEGVRKPSEPSHGPRFLTREQVAALMDVAPVERRFRYLFLVSTGVRRGEAWNLMWANVDWTTRELRVRTAAKGRLPENPFRSIPIPDDLMAALRRRHGAPNEAIFPNRQNWLRDLMQDARRARIGHVRIHDLRHCYASWLAQSGRVTLQEIQMLMGHRSIKTTLTYAFLIPGQQRHAAAVINSVLAETEKKTGNRLANRKSAVVVNVG